MTIYVEYMKELTKNGINDYNKVVGYKVNIQKSLTFLYTSNEQV